MSDDQYEMLLEAGIITAQSITTTTTATTSNAQLNTVSIEKSRSSIAQGNLFNLNTRTKQTQ